MISIDAATKQMNMEVSEEEIRCELFSAYMLILQWALLCFGSFDHIAA